MEPGAIGYLLVAFVLPVLLWLVPILLILTSKRTQGGEKLAWILAVVFVSWFAWVFYLLLAPIKTTATQR